MLVISQFTLYADCRKGRRPSFVEAARPEMAKPLYEAFVAEARRQGVPVEIGAFQDTHGCGLGQLWASDHHPGLPATPLAPSDAVSFADYCAQLTRKSRSNFYYAFLFLTKEKRQATIRCLCLLSFSR